MLIKQIKFFSASKITETKTSYQEQNDFAASDIKQTSTSLMAVKNIKSNGFFAPK